jgi:hypothetical protein
MRVLAGLCEYVWEFALMADLEAAETRLSFDDILEAVQDSKRGRWFLQEFENRLQKRDTSSLLSAMSRLESRMGELSKTSGKPESLGAVSAAIASARNDLLQLGMGKDAMSSEGRLFADLAEMARKAMPAAVEGRAGIVRALKLVEEIEGVVIPPINDDRGADFFKPDADLFERKATSAKPTLVANPEPVPPIISTAKSEQPAAQPTGARLVIRRSSQVAEEASPSPEPSVVAETQLQQADSSEPPAAEKFGIDNPRIVIIRRRAEDMPDVTLGAESAA